MALKKGVCKNFENCTLADNNEIQEVDSSEFRCAECGKELYEYKEPEPPFPLKLILIIVAALLLIGGGVWAYFGLIKDRPLKPEESVSLSLNKEIISLYVGESDTLKATVYSQPEDAIVSVSFTTDNSNVINLGNDGAVKAIDQGEASIIVIAQIESGIADTSWVKVSIYGKTDTVDKIPPVGDDSSKPGTSLGKSKETRFPIGKYVGELKNGIPEGSGKFYYSCHVQIAKHDTDNPPHYAEAGDWFDGTWGNGDIVSGALYSKDGKIKEKIFAPKRYNPYDLHKEKCQ